MHCHWRQAVVKCMHSGGIKMFVHLRLLSQEYSTNSELEVWRLVRCFGIGVWKGPFGLVRLPWFGDMLNTNLEHYEVGTRFLIDIDFDMQANSWRYGEISIYIYIYTQWSCHVSAHCVIISDDRLCSITVPADFRFYKTNPCVQRKGLYNTTISRVDDSISSTSIKTSFDTGDDRYRNKQSVSFMIHCMLPYF